MTSGWQAVESNSSFECSIEPNGINFAHCACGTFSEMIFTQGSDITSLDQLTNILSLCPFYEFDNKN